MQNCSTAFDMLHIKVQKDMIRSHFWANIGRVNYCLLVKDFNIQKESEQDNDDKF